MRQIILDTETTGLETSQGHRIIEVGCIELVDRRHTGKHFHQYLNPERDIDAGASAVHGLSRERLATEPRFAEIAVKLFDFISGSELIIHNAPFDVGFLDMELVLLAGAQTSPGIHSPASAPGGDCAAASAPTGLPASVRAVCQILDTLALARARHPGQRNSLDALCKRYGIDNSHRELHGALLDARLLADVYLAMTGGQSLLALEQGARARGGNPELERSSAATTASVRPHAPLRVIEASVEELAAHAQLLALLQTASGGHCLWLQETTAASMADS